MRLKHYCCCSGCQERRSDQREAKRKEARHSRTQEPTAKDDFIRRSYQPRLSLTAFPSLCVIPSLFFLSLTHSISLSLSLSDPLTQAMRDRLLSADYEIDPSSRASIVCRRRLCFSPFALCLHACAPSYELELTSRLLHTNREQHGAGAVLILLASRRHWRQRKESEMAGVTVREPAPVSGLGSRVFVVQLCSSYASQNHDQDGVSVALPSPTPSSLSSLDAAVAAVA